METSRPRKEAADPSCSWPPSLRRALLALVVLGVLLAATGVAVARLRPGPGAAAQEEPGSGPELRRARQAVGPFFAPKTAGAAPPTTTGAPGGGSAPARGYYEEQRPVLVHAEGGPILAPRQPPSGPPRLIGQDPYGDGEGEGDGSEDDTYDNEDYDRSRQRSDYYDEQAEAWPRGGGAERPALSPWSFATPTPTASDRKLQPRLGYVQRNRDPYDLYGDYDYPYMGPVRQQQPQDFPPRRQPPPRYPAPAQQQQRPQDRLRPAPQPQPQARRPAATPSSPPDAAPAPGPAQEPLSVLSVVKQLRTMWDLYRAFTSAWDTFAAHRQRNEQQQLKQQPPDRGQGTRINSRQPPKFVERRNKTASSTPAPRPAAATAYGSTTPPTSMSPSTTDLAALPPARNEPRAGEREKRQSWEQPEATSAVSESAAQSEGRYIKGDPLKGYYDFVITEGSYKFWAVFQVATAILIIYSTFAAIYYSKVNPLVSDYDYTDYLGGARSLSGGDLDFVDDEDAGSAPAAAASTPRPWLQEWTARAGHSVQFVLDAIDRLPVDHEVRPQ